MKKRKREPEIAVIGMAGRFPGANDIDEFWQNLVNGKETISFFSDKELLRAGIDAQVLKNDQYVKAKGILEDLDLFDADFFGYPPAEAEKMDPQLRVLHECCWQALENAGYCPDDSGHIIGAYFGANENHGWFYNIMSNGQSTADGFEHFVLNSRDYIATRISYKLNLKGPSVTALTACSTSLVTIHLACQGILRDECNMAIAGGVSLSFPYKSGYMFQEGMLLSPDGHTRTFDSNAEGCVFSDGVGVVVLKELKQAIKDGDNIYAVIKGSATNNDGNDKIGFTAPSVEGQTKVIQTAHEAAHVHPESISYLEAHGTATRLGDPIEIRALTKAFKTDQREFCAIGAVKSNIGHLNIAAGVASFIKVVLSLQNQIIPLSLHFQSPNPEIDFSNSPFYVNNKLHEWTTNGFPRRAGVSAFGFGGTNAHLVLEEAPNTKKSKTSKSQHVLILSAKTESALASQANQLTHYLKKYPDTDLANASYTLARGRKYFQKRQFVVGSNVDEIITVLKKSKNSITQAQEKNRLVFLFPGQGAQYVGMAEGLYRQEPVFREHVDHCSEILIDHLQLDIRDILYPKEENGKQATHELTQTVITQPTLFVISFAMAKLWNSWGVQPDALLGHSVGEFVAACLAGVFSLEDALGLVAKRGQLMQQLPKGKMVAVTRSEEEMKPFLNSEISLAALNTPTLCVLAGSEPAVKDLCKQFSDLEIHHQVLQTSHAFHSHMMEPILDEFIAISNSIFRGDPKLPMLSTVTGDWIQNGEMTDLTYWSSNLRQPVLYSSAVQKVAFDEKTILLEVGPGRTLTALTKMHASRNNQVTVFASIPGAGANQDDIASMYITLGNIWSSGFPVDWEKFYQRGKFSRIPLPTYPFERQNYWFDVKPMTPGTSLQQKTLVKNQKISEWFYIPSWKQTTFLNHDFLKSIKKQSWLVFVDECGFGQKVMERLKKLNQNVVAVRVGVEFKKLTDNRWQINPVRRSDYELLRDKLKDMRFFPQQILYLWTVTNLKEPQQNGYLKKSKHNPGFTSLINLAQILGKETLPEEIVLSVISNNMQHVTGEEVISPVKAPILGPLKVIPQEYPDVRCLHIDIEYPNKKSVPTQELIDHLLAESFSNLSDPTIAYRGKHRWLQSYESVQIEKTPKRFSKIRKNGVYLITGGMGGIGLVLAEYLGKRYQAKLILTGRSVFPAKELWPQLVKQKNTDKRIKQKIRKLQKIEAAGAEVHIISADVCKQRKMRSELGQIVQKTGPVHGVIHAAGLPGEGIIQLKDLKTANEILAPKINGTQVLDKILDFEKLDFVVLCSSVAALLGGIGLVDYSAANAYMDSFAIAASSQRKHRVLSINWDMWGEVGMGLTTKMPDELQYWLEKELRDGITSKEGIDVFERLLRCEEISNVVVSTRDLGARIDLWIRREFVKNKKASLEKKSSRPRYNRKQTKEDFKEPQSDMETSMSEIWGQLFGIEKIGRDDNFYELGGHSLLAASLVNKLKKEFETSISIRDVMDYPTVKELSERMLEFMDAT